jgi:hypothetical protein
MVAKPSVNADKYIDDASEDDAQESKVTKPAQSGWDSAEKALKSEKSDDYIQDLKFDEEPVLVKFIGDGPFKVYRQHWIERQGKKSFVCLEDDCPLCEILGDEPRNKFSFTVAILSEGAPEIRVLTASPTLFRQLKAAHEDARKGPLNKHFWALSRTGTGPKTTYIIDMVRARDLEEEWDLNPVALDEALEEFEALPESTIYVTPHAELVDIAKASA